MENTLLVGYSRRRTLPLTIHALTIASAGYIVHANGIHFPWAMQMDGTPFPSVTSAPEAWDSISDEAKIQIFAFIGFLEFVSSVMNGALNGIMVHLGDSHTTAMVYLYFSFTHFYIF
jgi:hypothetical protein